MKRDAANKESDAQDKAEAAKAKEAAAILLLAEAHDDHAIVMEDTLAAACWLETFISTHEKKLKLEVKGPLHHIWLSDETLELCSVDVPGEPVGMHPEWLRTHGGFEFSGLFID